MHRGIIGMSVGDSMALAFEPYAAHIGRSRSTPWMDELVDFIAEQDTPLTWRLHESLVLAATRVADEFVPGRWLALSATIDLLRLVGPDGQLPALKASANAIAKFEHALPNDVHTRLLATTLLAVLATSGKDKRDAVPLASQLATDLVKRQPPQDTQQKASFASRLQAFGIPPEKVEGIGLKLDQGPRTFVSKLTELLGLRRILERQPSVGRGAT